MLTPENIRAQVETLTKDLIELSLCNHQKFPFLKERPNNIKEVGFGHEGDLSIVLKNVPYHELYDELYRIQAYNLKMVDCALLQLMYRFKDNQIENHRLAFFPSPHLEEYQNNPEIYEEDELYAEVIRKNVVPFPLRFDFDMDDEVAIELDHPISHLTLGQYSNCRIPVSAPLTPYIFISFILRNFYNTAYRKFCDNIQCFESLFAETIIGNEKKVIHIQIPIEGLL